MKFHPLPEVEGKESAFTLAEVLVTLGVIGIVAAMTMPSLIANYKKQQTVTQLKKVYSEFSQALTMAIVKEESLSGYEFATKEDGFAFMEDHVFPYMNVAKICKTNSEVCFSQSNKYLNNSNWNTSGHFSFVLADGAAFAVSVFPNYFAMYVDVNGLKLPNTLGRDIFRVDYSLGERPHIDFVGTELTREEAISGGTLNPTYGCNRNGLGMYCAGLIMMDGWEILDDYPW